MRRKALEATALRWVPGEGPVDIRPLTAGLTNQSCRVVRAGRLYVLRVAARHSPELGLDRSWECKVLGAAAAAGLAPAVACCHAEAGILVADWVAGRTPTPAEIEQPEGIDAMATLLRRVHALPIPQPARALGPAAWIGHYTGALARRGLEPRRSGKLHATALALIDRLAEARQSSAEQVLCHGDVHRLNVLHGASPLLFDWEYAHVADRYWDVAGWISNNDWGASDATAFLAAYLGRAVAAAEAAHLHAMVWLYEYVCLLWSELYAGLGHPVDRGGVAARAERLRARLAGHA